MVTLKPQDVAGETVRFKGIKEVNLTLYQATKAQS